jgi:hypothetical protein
MVFTFFCRFFVLYPVFFGHLAPALCDFLHYGRNFGLRVTFQDFLSFFLPEYNVGRRAFFRRDSTCTPILDLLHVLVELFLTFSILNLIVASALLYGLVGRVQVVITLWWKLLTWVGLSNF